MPDQPSTRADIAAPPEPWTPRKAEVGETLSAGTTLGKPAYSQRLRRLQAEDKDVGVLEETVLEGWKVKEKSPGVWVADSERK